MLYDGVYWHPTAGCILWPVWTPSCPSCSCYLPGHCSEPTLPVEPLPSRLSPWAWFSAACLTATAHLQAAPIGYTPLPPLTAGTSPASHGGVPYLLGTHITLMVPRNHPPFYAETDPEYPRSITYLGGEQDSQHSPVALPLMTTVRLRLSGATVPPIGYRYGQEGSKVRPCLPPSLAREVHITTYASSYTGNASSSMTTS